MESGKHSTLSSVFISNEMEILGAGREAVVERTEMKCFSVLGATKTMTFERHEGSKNSLQISSSPKFLGNKFAPRPSNF